MPDWLLLFIPPVAGAVIGYFTNDLAIQMLFRPYKAIYIGKTRLPFTPGLIPRNQPRLAQKVSDTILSSLLTPSELEKIAMKLLERERVKSAILWLLQLALNKLQSDQEDKTAKIIGDILEHMFGESLPRLIKVFARQDSFLEAQINQIYDRVLMDFQLSPDQARQFTNWLLVEILSPDTLRQTLVEFLSDRNIQVLDEGFREKTSGTYWVFANLFGLSSTLTRLRDFCVEEPSIANARLQQLLFSLEVRNRLKNWLLSLSLQTLPESTIDQLRVTIQSAVRSYIRDKGSELLKGIGESIDWERLSSILLNRLQNSTILLTSLDVVSDELALMLERYLEKELGQLMAQTIPILALDKIIMERVNGTSPENLEGAIQGIVKSELQAIVNLGGILGCLIGLFQTGLMLWG
jgi:uncharacterized membrane protein YheB (UPF0754 family)